MNLSNLYIDICIGICQYEVFCGYDLHRKDLSKNSSD